jgi:uncharacterized protein
MKVDISRILGNRNESIHLEGNLGNEILDASPLQDYVFLGDVEYNVDIVGAGEDILVRGIVKGNIQLECSRCLAPIQIPFIGEIEDIYTTNFARGQKSRDIEKREREIKSEDLELRLIEGKTLNLNDSLVESIVLAIPAKAVCKEDCKGLCPHCGINLNKEECGCTNEEIDPRWEMLKKLKK